VRRPLADLLADAAGLVTLGIGTALTVAPTRAGGVLGLPPSPAAARVIGGIDLGLGAGLLAGRPRWPWMAARAAFNVVLGARYLGEARRPGGNSRAMGGAVGMAALTVLDGVGAVALWRRAARA